MIPQRSTNVPDEIEMEIDKEKSSGPVENEERTLPLEDKEPNKSLTGSCTNTNTQVNVVKESNVREIPKANTDNQTSQTVEKMDTTHLLYTSDVNDDDDEPTSSEAALEMERLREEKKAMKEAYEGICREAIDNLQMANSPTNVAQPVQTTSAPQNIFQFGGQIKNINNHPITDSLHKIQQLNVSADLQKKMMEQYINFVAKRGKEKEEQIKVDKPTGENKILYVFNPELSSTQNGEAPKQKELEVPESQNIEGNKQLYAVKRAKPWFGQMPKGKLPDNLTTKFNFVGKAAKPANKWTWNFAKKNDPMSDWTEEVSTVLGKIETSGKQHLVEDEIIEAYDPELYCSSESDDPDKPTSSRAALEKETRRKERKKKRAEITKTLIAALNKIDSSKPPSAGSSTNASEKQIRLGPQSQFSDIPIEFRAAAGISTDMDMETLVQLQKEIMEKHKKGSADKTLTPPLEKRQATTPLNISDEPKIKKRREEFASLGCGEFAEFYIDDQMEDDDMDDFVERQKYLLDMFEKKKNESKFTPTKANLSRSHLSKDTMAISQIVEDTLLGMLDYAGATTPSMEGAIKQKKNEKKPDENRGPEFDQTD